MSLHLDARQRAMLQEMGVTIWAPAQVSAAPAPVNDAARSQRTAAEPPTPAPAVAAAGGDTAATPRAVREQRAAAPGGAPAPRPPAPQDGSPTPALVLHAAQALYPTADPAQTPAGLGAGWLVVAESLSPTEPLAGDAGHLLDNMLRAMQLHRHPRVFLAALERPQAGNATNALEIAPAL
ncbi:MAG: uracil-DNA glycosylase family protein, partial [Acidovorax defluvii]